MKRGDTLTTAISLHSHKGGSGKTLVTINLASYLVRKGYRVALMDLDLSAPSLHTYAPGKLGEVKTLNDYLLHDTPVDQVFFDATYLIGNDVPGTLFMGLANIDGAAIAEVNQRDTDSLLNDLYLLMELVRNILPSDPWNVDYILIDTSPGLTTHAINGVAITDKVIMLLRLVNADVEGTRHFLDTLYQSVQPDTAIIVNQIADHILAAGGSYKIQSLIQNRIVNKISAGSVKLGGILPTDKEVISSEFDYAMEFLDTETPSPRPIHYKGEYGGSFSHKFGEIMKRILEE